ncbi:hypothetical protein IVB30_16785 [Bradyrhizobium sp. 200]|uniref:hypothetical protein n=1 Tax=Bradyrhizobium sp. 200 TaxID=2782665 RepID=UPI001FFEC173|nr:hypothetical protein [Bradyrhizobium sp. 200]UPJ54688.1 hypothetical protein IVB30_16785 [Bradyrhizobium sp. 200]
MAALDVHKGMPPVKLPREEFEKRYRSRFADPAGARGPDRESGRGSCRRQSSL